VACSRRGLELDPSACHFDHNMVTYYGFGDTARLQGGFDGSIPGSCNLFAVSSASTLVRTSRIVLDEHPVRAGLTV
jgi:hypothetical protein